MRRALQTPAGPPGGPGQAGAPRAGQREGARGALGAGSAGGRGALVGRDVVRTRVLSPVRRRLLPFALAGLVIAGLGLAALRIDMIRMRYGLADAMSEEKALLEQRRELLARLREQRDPARLTRLAARRGFQRPARIIDLSGRTGTPATAPALAGDPAEGR